MLTNIKKLILATLLIVHGQRILAETQQSSCNQLVSGISLLDENSELNTITSPQKPCPINSISPNQDQFNLSEAFEIIPTKIMLSKMKRFNCQDHYMSLNMDKNKCNIILKKFLNILNYDWINKVAFQKELVALLKDERVIRYLLHTKEMFSRGKTIGIWEHTIKFAKDEGEALKWVAIIFQNLDIKSQNEDTDYSMFTNTLREYYKDIPNKSVNLLEKVLIESKQYSNTFYSLPKNLKFKQNYRSVYHFYVPAYLSKRLLQKSKDEVTSFSIPFVMNNIFEFFKNSVSICYFLGNEPRPFKIKKEDLPYLKDIYAGYLGSLYGINKQNKAISFDKFISSFSKDPTAFLKKMLFRPIE